MHVTYCTIQFVAAESDLKYSCFFIYWMKYDDWTIQRYCSCLIPCYYFFLGPPPFHLVLCCPSVMIVSLMSWQWHPLKADKAKKVGLKMKWKVVKFTAEFCIDFFFFSPFLFTKWDTKNECAMQFIFSLNKFEKNQIEEQVRKMWLVWIWKDVWMLANIWQVLCWYWKYCSSIKVSIFVQL